MRAASKVAPGARVSPGALLPPAEMCPPVLDEGEAPGLVRPRNAGAEIAITEQPREVARDVIIGEVLSGRTVGDLCAKVAQVITGQTFLSAIGPDWHDRHFSVACRFRDQKRVRGA